MLHARRTSQFAQFYYQRRGQPVRAQSFDYQISPRLAKYKHKKSFDRKPRTRNSSRPFELYPRSSTAEMSSRSGSSLGGGGGLSAGHHKLAEKLSLINDRGVGMLTRIYNIKKVLLRYII